MEQLCCSGPTLQPRSASETSSRFTRSSYSLRSVRHMMKSSSLAGRGLYIARGSAPASDRRSRLAVTAEDPRLVKAARGEPVDRVPAWMMRQAGRYMQSYRDLATKYPSFRERSETTDLIVEITMQPFHSFKPDGVILFSDILTPLPALGVGFEIDDIKGPIMSNTVTTMEEVNKLHPLEMDQLSFVGESLSILRKEVGDEAAVLGFVGSPWTLATYVVEGKTTRIYKNIKGMMYSAPEVLKALLSHLADQCALYIEYQIESGAQCVQIFDSWGGQLPPDNWEEFSRPYIERVVQKTKAKYPNVPLTLYANGSGGLLERMATTGVDCVGLDWSVDMADGRRRMGDKVSVQGNIDPILLFSDTDVIQEAVGECCKKAGDKGHILNLGHGVLVGTPEEGVAAFFDAVKKHSY